MKTFRYPDAMSIATTNKELVVGQKYDYKEGSLVGECEFIDDVSDDKYHQWKFKWTIYPLSSVTLTDENSEFTCTELKNSNFCYSGMYHIYPQFSYLMPNRRTPSVW